MKENSIEEDIKNAEHFIKSIKTDKEYKEENGWHGYYNKEIVDLARILEHILSDYKRVLKENEELRQEKIDNQKINLLAQNSMLDYQNGYEDGKANRRSAVQIIIDNQQYYIFQKQIEIYEKEIEKLQKENEELKLKYKLLYNGKIEMIKARELKIPNFVVSKQKIKDKIEELQNGPLKINENNKYYYETDAYNKIIIQVLQGLIEGRK